MKSVHTGRATAAFIAGVLMATAGAVAFRLPRLDVRPMHGDEANQAVKAAAILEEGLYRYDRDEHHGPTLYYATLPSLWLSGERTLGESNEAAYRIVPVVFGAALVALLVLVADGMGRGPAILAGVLTAISPAMVFYSRYYIQETLLVFFTLAAIGCGWRWLRTRRVVWAAASGAFVGLMHATKETWILAAAAAGIGLVLTVAWTLVLGWIVRPRTGGLAAGGEGEPSAPAWRGLLVSIPVALLAGCAVAVVLYSSFGTHWSGPLDSILAYSTYFRRGGEGGIHAHPWNFYLELLVKFHRPARGLICTEVFIVGLAAVGGLASLGWSIRDAVRTRNNSPDAQPSSRDPSGPFATFLTCYTLLLTALYAAVSYKTPWCMLGFLHGMILLAAIGAWSIVRMLPWWPLKAVAWLALLAGAVHLGWASHALNFRFPADPRNPYVYAHTSSDVLKLAEQIEHLAQVSPEGHQMMIHIVTPENYWPLPWYLRRFNRDHVGCWNDAAQWRSDTNGLPPPSVMIVTGDVQEAVDAALGVPYQQMFRGLRPGVLISVYVRQDLWNAFLASRDTEKEK